MTKPVYFFHQGDFDEVSFDVVLPNKEHPHNPEKIPAYKWLEDKIGFWPLWLAVGSRMAVYMTGYEGNWTQGANWNTKNHHILWRPWSKGKAPNKVLFMFPSDCLDGVFVDYMTWLDVWTTVAYSNGAAIDDPTCDKLLKKGMSKQELLDYSAENPLFLNFLVEKLDLRKACSVWCRNKATQKKLIAMGFANVQVVRLLVDADKFTSPPTLE